MDEKLLSLQKDYDLLTQAHNSVEEMNSVWAQQHADQLDLIRGLRAEVDELRTRVQDTLQANASELQGCKDQHAGEVRRILSTHPSPLGANQTLTQNLNLIQGRGGTCSARHPAGQSQRATGV